MESLLHSLDRSSLVSSRRTPPFYIQTLILCCSRGLDRCSSVMRLRLMIRDRIFPRINERSTQIVARLWEGRKREEERRGHRSKQNNHFRKSPRPRPFAGSGPEIAPIALESPPTKKLSALIKLTPSFTIHWNSFSIVVGSFQLNGSPEIGRR